MAFRKSVRVRGGWVPLLGLMALLQVAAFTLAEEAPGSNESPPRQPVRAIGRLAENLGKLDLSPEQREKAAAVVDQVRRQIRNSEASDKPIRQVMEEARGRLQEILTPDQQSKLRDLMQETARPERPEKPPETTPPQMSEPKKPEPQTERPTGKTPSTKEPAKKDTPAMKDPPTMQDGDGMNPQKRAAAPKPPADPKAEIVAIETGRPAPDFNLKTVADKPVQLANQKGRVIVLVFGSYTSPSFRQRVPILEKLAKDYGQKASFYIVYTREAHAVGEWEVTRNKNEEISLEQPKSEAERLTLAKQATSTLRISLPVLIDDMDNTVANAYGLTPNGAVVIGRDGKIAGTQRWFEPLALRGVIDTAAAVRLVKE